MWVSTLGLCTQILGSQCAWGDTVDEVEPFRGRASRRLLDHKATTFRRIEEEEEEEGGRGGGGGYS